MEKNKDTKRTIRHKLVLIPDSMKGYIDIVLTCPHRTITKTGKIRSCFVDYEPTPNELNKIMSDRKFSRFGKINSIKHCKVCGVIVAEKKETVIVVDSKETE